jgi:hypothetical protein
VTARAIHPASARTMTPKGVEFLALTRAFHLGRSRMRKAPGGMGAVSRHCRV